MLSGEQAFQISSIDDTLPTRIGYTLSSTFLHDGSGLITGGHQDSTVRLHRLASTSTSTQADQYLDEHKSQVISLSLSRNGQKLLTGDTQGVILLWDLGSATVVGTFSILPPQAALSLSFSADADLVAVCGSTEGSVYIWKTSSRTAAPTILRNTSFRHLSAVFANGGATVSVHPNTPILLATVCSDGPARIYSVRWGTSVHAMRTIEEELGGPAKALCWFPGDCGRLLVTFKDTIHIAILAPEHSTSRRQTSKRRLATRVLCEGHTKPITAICLSPCARYIASTARDGPRGHATVRVWNGVTGEQLLRPLLVRGGVRKLEFSPQGNRLLTIDVNGAVTVWDFGVLEVSAEVQGAVAQIGELAKAEEEMTEALQLLVKDECSRFIQMSLDDCKMLEDILRTRQAEAMEKSLKEFQSSSEALAEEFWQNVTSQSGGMPEVEVEKNIQDLKDEQAEMKKHLETVKSALEKSINGLQKMSNTILKKLDHVSTSTAGASDAEKNKRPTQKPGTTQKPAEQHKKSWNSHTASDDMGSDKARPTDLSALDFSLESSQWSAPVVSRKAKRRDARHPSFAPPSAFSGSSQFGALFNLSIEEGASEDAQESETEY